MKLRYERPLPDLSYLVTAPLRLDLGGGRVAEIQHWSLEGIVPPARLEGDDGEARLVVPFHAFEIGFTVRLQRDRAANLMRFVDLGPRETRLLTHFYREIVTGRAVSDSAMIAAMDVPVEPVPMELTPEEIAQAPRPAVPRILRAASVLGVYAVLAVLVYGPLVSPVREALTGPRATAAGAPPHVQDTAARLHALPPRAGPPRAGPPRTESLPARMP